MLSACPSIAWRGRNTVWKLTTEGGTASAYTSYPKYRLRLAPQLEYIFGREGSGRGGRRWVDGVGEDGLVNLDPGGRGNGVGRLGDEVEGIWKGVFGLGSQLDC
jgi:hypothetical protein